MGLYKGLDECFWLIGEKWAFILSKGAPPSICLGSSAIILHDPSPKKPIPLITV